ncbi:MAG: hypothetical protein ACFE0Q_09120 [Anaerolineae bacterium]
MSDRTFDTLDGGGGSATDSLETIIQRIRYYQSRAPFNVGGIAEEVGVLNGYIQAFNADFERLEECQDSSTPTNADNPAFQTPEHTASGRMGGPRSE